MIFVRLNAWKLLCIILILLIITQISDNYWINLVANIIIYSFYIGWYLAVGLNLNKLLDENNQKSETFFIINCLYVFMILSLSSILENGEGVEQKMPLYMLLMLGYFVVAFLHIIYFTSDLFNTVQMDQSSTYKQMDYRIILLSFFFLIIGIWVIQPKLRSYFKG